MTEKKLFKITNEEIEKMRDYLSGYKLARDLLALDKYEKEFIRSKEWENERPGDVSLSRVKMFEIRHFILSLPTSNEKILLYLHYIDCEPIERCGNIMGISRSSAFRLKKKALSLACSIRNKNDSAKFEPLCEIA